MRYGFTVLIVAAHVAWIAASGCSPSGESRLEGNSGITGRRFEHLPLRTNPITQELGDAIVTIPPLAFEVMWSRDCHARDARILHIINIDAERLPLDYTQSKSSWIMPAPGEDLHGAEAGYEQTVWHDVQVRIFVYPQRRYHRKSGTKVEDHCGHVGFRLKYYARIEWTEKKVKEVLRGVRSEDGLTWVDLPVEIDSKHQAVDGKAKYTEEVECTTDIKLPRGVTFDSDFRSLRGRSALVSAADAVK